MARRVIRITESNRERLVRRLSQTMLAQALRFYTRHNTEAASALARVDFESFASNTVDAWLRDYRMTPRK